jgi:hypothetical protein
MARTRLTSGFEPSRDGTFVLFRFVTFVSLQTWGQFEKRLTSRNIKACPSPASFLFTSRYGLAFISAASTPFIRESNITAFESFAPPLFRDSPFSADNKLDN